MTSEALSIVWAHASISARKLEPVVWDRILGLLLNPKRLHEGYTEAIKKEQELQNRQRILLEKLYCTVGNLEKRRHNLVIAYTDPDLRLTRSF
jgi:hypothetical protein